MQTVTIGPNDAGQRVDKFLQKNYQNLPVSMMYKAIRQKDIKLNGPPLPDLRPAAGGGCPYPLCPGRISRKNPAGIRFPIRLPEARYRV